MSVDIVIVNWNSGDYLRKCLKSIFVPSNIAYINAVIIVDNNSNDNSLKDIPQNDKLILIKNKDNLGFSKACNQGFKVCTAKYVLLLNPDAQLFGSTLGDCNSFMESHADVDIMGCQLLDDHGKITVSCARFLTPKSCFYKSIGLTNIFPKIFTPPNLMYDWDHKESRYVDQVMGAFMFMRGNLFEKLGYFDEQFFVYFEELDFSKRLAEAGGKTYFNAAVKAVHSGHGTTNSVKAYRLFLNLKSRLLYAKKHFTRTGYYLVFTITFFPEFFTRIFFLFLKGKFHDCREVAQAYRKLTKS